ncbi:hypothetical protein ACMHYO_17510 [Allopusillimonas ginsengisoli]
MSENNFLVDAEYRKAVAEANQSKTLLFTSGISLHTSTQKKWII